jgi:hypothetical protein
LVLSPPAWMPPSKHLISTGDVDRQVDKCLSALGVHVEPHVPAAF